MEESEMRFSISSRKDISTNDDHLCNTPLQSNFEVSCIPNNTQSNGVQLLFFWWQLQLSYYKYLILSCYIFTQLFCLNTKSTKTRRSDRRKFKFNVRYHICIYCFLQTNNYKIILEEHDLITSSPLIYKYL